MRFVSTLILTIAATAGPALAHTGTGSGFAMLDGLLHPLQGADHLLTMVGVGLWAALVGGWAKWLWPAAFVVMMAAGGALALAGIAIPYVEPLILASVIGIGAAVALGLRLPVAAGAAVCAGFALAHGHAHGSELQIGSSAGGYVIGFITATVALHAVGIALGLLLQRMPLVVRSVGAAITATGAVLAFT